MGLSCCGCSDRGKNTSMLFNQEHIKQSKEILENFLIALGQEDRIIRRIVEDRKKSMPLTFPKIKSAQEYEENLKGRLDYKNIKILLNMR